MAAPKGKHIYGMVRVGEKGQIVIPSAARKQFDIKPGDSLVVLGDEKSGLALIKASILIKLSEGILDEKIIEEESEHDGDQDSKSDKDL